MFFRREAASSNKMIEQMPKAVALWEDLDFAKFYLLLGLGCCQTDARGQDV